MMQTQKPIQRHQHLFDDAGRQDFENLLHAIETIAALLPDKVALIDQGTSYTYRMLNEQANQLAYYLRGIGVSQKSSVAVCLRQSAQRVIAFLAVMKTGAPYLPIDGQFPESRIKLMVEDAGVDLMLTEKHYWYKVDGFARVSLAVDGLPVDIELTKLPTANQKENVSANACAYIIYTSGSSGRPKGVMISHAALWHFVSRQADVLGISTSSRTLQFASPSFDAAVIDMWVPLSRGATVLLYPDNKIVGAPLLDFIVMNEVDILPLLPPAVLASLPSDRPVGRLRTIAIGGEAATENTIRNWYKRVRLINSYGPTEATVAVSNYTFMEEPNPRIIGTVLPGNVLRVVDGAGRELAADEVGELLVSGPQLALGYINRPQEMAASFIRIPGKNGEAGEELFYRTGDRAKRRQDGLLEYAGREDEQVKIRGYRIELGEIEHGMAQLPQVAKVAVKVHKPEKGLSRLVAFVQPVTGEGIASFSDIRAKLQQLMPSYMLPDKIVTVENLPLNHAGKVDKEQLLLPELEDSGKRTAIQKTANLTEQVQLIWRDLLGLEDVPLHADFFDLGGHSLLLAQLHMQLPEMVQARIALPELYTFTTIQSFVEEVERRLGEVEISQKVRALQVEQELLNDSELPFDFTVTELPDAALLASPKRIFLTGVTGFVGSHLLDELLRNHPQAKIHCLVRAVDLPAAWGRIKETFQKYNLAWQEGDLERVVPHVGDLARAGLGLAKDEYEGLLDCIDVIYHSGSSVSYVQPYQLIKKPNIDGLHHMLHLAVTRRVKHLVLLSSMGVFSWGRPFTGKTWMYEDDPIEQNLPAVCRDLGYIKSKWVMESIAEKARRKGLPIINFRLGFAVCHGTSGATVKNQWWGALMRSCAELKSFPLVMGLKDELTTVDYMCKAIVHIGRKPEAVGQNFHLSPLPENDVSLTDFCAKMNEYFNLGLTGMEYHQWLKQWRHQAELPIYPLLSLFTEDVHEGKCLVEAYENTYYYDRSNTRRMLADIQLEPPVFNKEVMHPYLKFLGIV
ncbi:amino acid adenylation domain-containing protein [Olivibacter sp. CPCC 100613]|uniref:amino acid adenylation domain-containing protein n=1 Tax=Olivibacter sp. CPCC 100613 TaxID=3079931 RepID=UPI002FF6D451